MPLRDFLSKVTPKGWAVGGAFIAAGVLFAFLAISTHMSILDLTPTTDPGQLQRISDLEGLRAVYLNLAFGGLFLGLFAVLVLTERSVPSEILNRQTVSQVRMTEELVSNLNLKGGAAYIPAKHALTREKVLIPTANGGLSLPIMTDDIVFSLGADRATLGIFLTPSGLDILDGFEEDLGVSNMGVGLEALEGNLQIAKLGAGLVRDFKIKQRGEETVLRIEHSAYLDPCRTVRATMPEVCRQAACPICSAFLTGIARASGKIAKVSSVENDTDRIQFHLRLIDWD